MMNENWKLDAGNECKAGKGGTEPNVIKVNNEMSEEEDKRLDETHDMEVKWEWWMKNEDMTLEMNEKSGIENQKSDTINKCVKRKIRSEIRHETVNK